MKYFHVLGYVTWGDFLQARTAYSPEELRQILWEHVCVGHTFDVQLFSYLMEQGIIR